MQVPPSPAWRRRGTPAPITAVPRHAETPAGSSLAYPTPSSAEALSFTRCAADWPLAQGNPYQDASLSRSRFFSRVESAWLARAAPDRAAFVGTSIGPFGVDVDVHL